MRLNIFTAANAPRRVARTQTLVKRQIDRRCGHCVFKVGAISDELPAGREVLHAAAHQCGAGGPWRDVQHVGTVDQIEAVVRWQPACCHHVKQHGRPSTALRCG